MEEKVTIKGFFNILGKIIVKPSKDPGYWFYFLLIIVIIGGLGFWPYILDYNRGNLSISLTTYYMAILSSSCVKLSLEEHKVYKSYTKPLRLFSYILLAIGLIILIAESRLALIVIATLISWFMWWISNFDNKTILSEPTAPTLNKLTADDQPMEGNLNNIKSD